MPDAFKRFMNKWGVLLTIAFTGGLVFVGSVIVKAVHIAELPDKLEKIETRITYQETNSISRDEFWKAHGDTEAKLNAHAVTLGRIEQKIDDLGTYQYRGASAYQDTPPHRTSQMPTDGKN